jgi:hypothetical protein
LWVLVIFYANFWNGFWRILVKWPKKVGFCPLLKMFLASEKPRFYAGLRGVVAKNPLFSLINCEKNIYFYNE